MTTLALVTYTSGDIRDRHSTPGRSRIMDAGQKCDWSGDMTAKTVIWTRLAAHGPWVRLMGHRPVCT
jgi:hypothetical protein